MWAFCWVCFSCPGFQRAGRLVASPALGFLCVQHPSWKLSLSWASAVVGFCLTGPSWDCFSEVKSQSRHHIHQGSVWFPLFCLTTAKIWNDWWTSVTAPCYSSVLFRKQRKIHPRVVGAGGRPKRHREKRSPPRSILAPLLLPLGLPYVNWASQEGSLFYLRSSLWSSDLPLFYFHGLSPALSFSHLQSGLIVPILTT